MKNSFLYILLGMLIGVAVVSFVMSFDFSPEIEAPHIELQLTEIPATFPYQEYDLGIFNNQRLIIYKSSYDNGDVEYTARLGVGGRVVSSIDRSPYEPSPEAYEWFVQETCKQAIQEFVAKKTAEELGR